MLTKMKNLTTYVNTKYYVRKLYQWISLVRLTGYIKRNRSIIFHNCTLPVTGIQPVLNLNRANIPNQNWLSLRMPCDSYCRRNYYKDEFIVLVSYRVMGRFNTKESKVLTGSVHILLNKLLKMKKYLSVRYLECF